MDMQVPVDPMMEQQLLPDGYAGACGVHMQSICTEFQRTLSEKSEFQRILDTEKELIACLKQNGNRFHTCFEFFPQR